MIKLINISKDYNDDMVVHALKDVSLEIPDSKFISIVGKSGSGKTTLLNIIGALDRPTKGEIYFQDLLITSLDDKELAEYRNKNIGYIFQDFYLEPSFTVLENVCMPLVIKGMKKKEREEIVLKYLALLGIDKKANVMVSKLSGGEKQRCAIARALVNGGNIILADEPTGNLDSINSKIVLDELKKLTSIGKTVILVTHNEDDASKYSDYVIRIKDGVIDNEIK